MAEDGGDHIAAQTGKHLIGPFVAVSGKLSPLTPPKRGPADGGHLNMSLEALVQAITAIDIPPPGCYDVELFGDDQTRYKAYLSDEDLEVEIPARQKSAMKMFLRTYKKLCRSTRNTIDERRRKRVRPKDVPADHRAEAFYHTEPEHYSNSECGYCLKEILLDVLREGGCLCRTCRAVAREELDKSLCWCEDCETNRKVETFDRAERKRGRFVVRVTSSYVARGADALRRAT